MLRRIFQLALLLSVLPCLGSGLALAQPANLGGTTGSESAVESDVTLADPLTKDAVQALISRMSDREVRQLLLDKLDAAAQTPSALTGSTFDQMLALLSESTEKVASSLAFNIINFGAFLSAQGNVFDRFSIWLGGTGLKRVSLSVVLAVGLGLLAERAVYWVLFRRPVRGSVGISTLIHAKGI